MFGRQKERLEFKKLDFANDSSIQNLLEVSIESAPSGFHLLRSCLIVMLLGPVRLMEEENGGKRAKDTAVTKPLLTKDTNANPMILPWKYFSAIGMLNCLSSSAHPDIAMTARQTSRLCIGPKRIHEKSVIGATRFLMCAATFGMNCKLDKCHGVEVFVDAAFVGASSKDNSPFPNCALSRKGCDVVLFGCLLF